MDNDALLLLMNLCGAAGVIEIGGVSHSLFSSTEIMSEARKAPLGLIVYVGALILLRGDKRIDFPDILFLNEICIVRGQDVTPPSQLPETMVEALPLNTSRSHVDSDGTNSSIRRLSPFCFGQTLI
ncbi:hypothetical protein BHG93_22845 [Salmonella enterica]|nr:hypothetical protein [Salmonella enterica]